MSLLDKGNTDVEVFLEEKVKDKDGNIRSRASSTPIKLRVYLEPVGQSGTAARRAEQDNEGYETEKVMRMRVRRSDSSIEIGAQSNVKIGNEMWQVFGDVTRYRGSPRTAHNDYNLRRS